MPDPLCPPMPYANPAYDALNIAKKLNDYRLQDGRLV